MKDTWGPTPPYPQAREVLYVLAYPNGNPLVDGFFNPLPSAPKYNVYEQQTFLSSTSNQQGTSGGNCGTGAGQVACDTFPDVITPYTVNDNPPCDPRSYIKGLCSTYVVQSAQTFTYGLPGQRPWDVHTVLRRIGAKTYCELARPGVLFLKKWNAQPQLLGMPPAIVTFTDSSYFSSPYMGLADTTPPNPPPCASWETQKGLNF
jgi:hypothetical protein